jgi:hypothetical protein
MRHDTPPPAQTGPERPGKPDQAAPPRDRSPDTTADVTAEADDPDPYAREFAIDELTGPGDED